MDVDKEEAPAAPAPTAMVLASSLDSSHSLCL